MGPGPGILQTSPCEVGALEENAEVGVESGVFNWRRSPNSGGQYQSGHLPFPLFFEKTSESSVSCIGSNPYGLTKARNTETIVASTPDPAASTTH